MRISNDSNKYVFDRGLQVKIHLKFYGFFKSAVSTGDIFLDMEPNSTIKSIVSHLISRNEFQNLRHLLLDSLTSDPRPNALILVSGREINTLRGLDTTLREGDEVAILPIAHGG